MIDKCPKADGIIRPILRGRDIGKYSASNTGLYLLFIPWHFPLHNDESIQGASIMAEEKFKTDYPVIYNYLLQHKQKLQLRNQAETGIRYEWYALQRFGSNYWQEFEKSKIIYPEITKFINFYLDFEDHYFVNNKCFIITGENIEFLTAFLNSSLFKFCFIDNFPELLGGTRELRKIFFDKIPIIRISKDQNQIFKDKILEIQKLKKENQQTIHLEKEVDSLIFDLYNLTEEERLDIGFIEIK